MAPAPLRKCGILNGGLALFFIASSVPFYAAFSFEGTVEISVSRWLALYLVAAEMVVVGLAAVSGWRPATEWKELPGHIRMAVTLWLAVASVATAFSSHFAYSATFQLFWIVHGLFAWALCAMLRSKWRGIRESLLVYFSFGLLLHSAGVYLVAWILLGPSVDEWQRYSFGTTNPRLYVFYAAALLGLGLGFLVSARNRATLLLAVILTFAAYHLFAWAGGRASFGTSLLLPVLVAALAPTQWKRLASVAIPGALLMFPLSLLTAPKHAIYGFKSIIERLGADAIDDEYSSGRFEIWERMLKQSVEKPIFGHGQIGTLDLIDDSSKGMALNAHNFFVHIVHAWGLLGLVVFAVGLLPFVPTIRARLDAQPAIAWPSFALLLALALTSLLDGTLFYNQPLFLCALGFAVLASVPSKQRRTSVVGAPAGGPIR